MKISLPQHVLEFVESMTTLTPPPDAIWLIGSRANGRATEQSDTDLLVFAPPSFLTALRARVPAPSAIDCLVVDAQGGYQDAWQEKSGSLAGLKWKQIGADTARYIGTKWVSDVEEYDDEPTYSVGTSGQLLQLNEKAICIYPST